MTPLFSPDLDWIKRRLRLSGAAQSDALAILDSAMARVRLGFYDELGEQLVNDLLATDFDEAPEDHEGRQRLRAALAEVIWLRAILYRDLPMLFMDSGGSAPQSWNEEGLIRPLGMGGLNAELQRMEVDLRDALARLRGETPTDARVFVNEPGVRQAVPTLFPFELLRD